jgi:hypothetical protein
MANDRSNALGRPRPRFNAFVGFAFAIEILYPLAVFIDHKITVNVSLSINRLRAGCLD